MLLNGIEVGIPEFVITSLAMLGQVAIPLMLFSLGVRLTRVRLNDVQRGITMAILCPVAGVALALLLIEWISMPLLHQQILLLFGGLPPAVVNFMLAEQYQRDPEQVASMVMVGNIAALLFIPLVLYWFILD